MLELLGSDRDFKRGFAEVRSGVRYDFEVRGYDLQSSFSWLRERLRPKGVALRIDPVLDA